MTILVFSYTLTKAPLTSLMVRAHRERSDQIPILCLPRDQQSFNLRPSKAEVGDVYEKAALVLLCGQFLLLILLLQCSPKVTLASKPWSSSVKPQCDKLK